MTRPLIIIFGATGDLTKRKIIPAIYKLTKENKLKHYAVVGVAHSDSNAAQILSSAKEFNGKVSRSIWTRLANRFYYFKLDFYSKQDYAKLQGQLASIEKKHHLSGNRVFYLATLPQDFDVITKNLANNHIADETQKRWCRLVYEKPFGKDLKSAKKMNQDINRVFKEKQVYRIDHYLGKEIVGNIAVMRFTNRILEPLWRREHIESVQINLTENIGMEGRRGRFYDSYGTLKDVVQNHVLQLLALTAMETPKMLVGEYIRTQKARLLKKVYVEEVLVGQYEGYRKEWGVNPQSMVETFAILKVKINTPRWKGVPFYIKVGKALDKKDTSIHLNFRHINCILTRNCPTDTNYFSIRIQPNEGFSVELNSKVPGRKYDILPVKMDFSQQIAFGPNTPEAYEILLEDILKGDPSVFVRNDEIEYAWKIIDKVEKMKGKLYFYKPGSKGPDKLMEFNKKHEIRWRA
ncbi:MAG TPA: glucose-6-phosphate dehydrogenase [Candidatus Nanoarchaeia archaeon]|nr:glucose-6-phosphate dehydrogenase [Candidatus Nanoarchaeia archaeon]